MSSEENKQIVRRGFEALIAGQTGPLQDVLAPDAVLHQCGILHPIPAQAIFRGEFPAPRRLRNREIRLERIIGEGDTVALHWRTSGLYADPDEPGSDGVAVNFQSMSFLRIANGRIAEIWNIQDVSTLQTQLSEASHASGIEKSV